MRRASEPGVASHSAEIERRLRDLADERIALMDETGLDMQVLSLTAPGLHGVDAGSPEIARRINDAVAEVVARRPDRFQAFATLPIARSDEAAEELDRCVRMLGFKGTMLCGRVGSKNLDDPAFLPVFRTAARLNAPIFLHPQAPSTAVRAAYYDGFAPQVSAALATYAIGWHYETGVQFLRLILAGVLDRMPGLQLILGHWGELVLFYAERFASLDRVAGLERSVATCLRENVWVTSSGNVHAPIPEAGGGHRRRGPAPLLDRLSVSVPPRPRCADLPRELRPRRRGKGGVRFRQLASSDRALQAAALASAGNTDSRSG